MMTLVKHIVRILDTFPQHAHDKIRVSRVWMGIKNLILVVQNCTKKSSKYYQVLVLRFKSGSSGKTDLVIIGSGGSITSGSSYLIVLIDIINTNQ
jgi:hypothetical protein